MTKNINLANLGSAQGFIISGDTSMSYIPVSAGDINGDGKSDIIISTGYSISPVATGSLIYVIYGSVNMLNIDLANLIPAQGFSITGATCIYAEGCSVSGAGDINNDGYNDIVIGTYLKMNSYSVISCVIYGGSSLINIDLLKLSPIQGFYIYGNQQIDNGYVVSNGGDFNGDGYSDIIIGSPSSYLLLTSSYIIFGSNSLNNIDLSNLSSIQGFSISSKILVYEGYANLAVSNARDFNGDGYDDIVISQYVNDLYIGNSQLDAYTVNAGISYIIYGRANLSNIDLSLLTSAQGFRIFGETAGPYDYYIGIGRQLSNVKYAGDVNGDGYADIIIGAPYLSIGAGKSYIIYGGIHSSNINLADLTATQGFAITGASVGSNSGRSVSSARDVNKDGYDDIIISAYENSYGISYVVYGGTGLNNIELSSLVPAAGFSITGTIIVGQSVCDAGDINGDGGADIIIDTANGAVVILNASAPSAPVFIPTSNITSSHKAHWYETSLFQKIAFSIGSFLTGVAVTFLVKETCFKILDNWETTATGAYKINPDINRGSIKTIMYNVCHRFYAVPHEIRKQIVNRQNSEQYADLSIITNKQPDVDGFEMSNLNKAEDNLSTSSVSKEYSQILDDEEHTVSDSNMVTFSDHQVMVNEISEPDTNSQYVNDVEHGQVLMSIDAMIDPVHVRLQNSEFKRFGEHLMITYKDLNTIFSYKYDKAHTLLEDSSRRTDALTIYQDSASTNNVPYSASNNLMISLFAATQLIEYLPIIKYTAQSTINYLGYNVTLPDISDYKTLLILTHLILGNAAAQLLPTESIVNGMIVSTISSGSYAMRLMAADYLKAQEVSDSPLDLAKQCGATIAAYTLPNIATYAAVQALLPGAAYAITGYDILASSSLGAMQCYSNYKAVAQSSEPTTADNVVPYIADAFAAYALSGYFGIDTSSSTALMMSIKNSMSIMAAVVATDSISRMIIDVAPQEVKEKYVESAFDYAKECINDIAALAADSYAHFFGNGADHEL